MVNLYKDIENVMAQIETKWQKQNYSADHFNEIVWEETTGLDFSPLGEVTNQLKLLELPGVRFQQQRSTFSDLYIQIFHNGRFMIEILNWWGGHVNVHDHDFSAVQFQLKGDALNAEYDFETTETAGALRFGELKVKESEIWKEGGRSLVNPGPDDPHSVFHIGEPTTSLLVRTTATPRYGAQSNYFPTVAAHYYVSNDIQRKKLTGLNLLSRKSPTEFCSSLEHFLNTQSLSENFFMLVKLGTTLFQDRYIDFLGAYANRGDQEAKLVESVAINNGIDFFKTKANDTVGISYAEKLAVFSVAASHNRENLKMIERDLRAKDTQLNLTENLNSFISKLDEDDHQMATQYFEMFGMTELLNEKL